MTLTTLGIDPYIANRDPYCVLEIKIRWNRAYTDHEEPRLSKKLLRITVNIVRAHGKPAVTQNRT